MSEEADISRILFTIFDGLEPQKIDQSDVVRLWSLEMQWFSPEESQSVIDALSDAGWISRQDVTLYLSDGVKLEIPSLGWRPMTRRMLSPPTYNLTEIDSSGHPASDLSQPRDKPIKDKDNQTKKEYPAKLNKTTLLHNTVLYSDTEKYTAKKKKTKK